MAKQIFFLVFLTIVYSSQAVLSEVNRGDFKKLSDYLNEKVVVDDGETNMNAAMELLAKGEQQDADLISAAETLVGLSSIAGKCDKEAIQILRENVDATNGGARQFGGSRSRLDKMIQQYAISYAKSCDEQWASKLTEEIGKFDVKTLSRVELFTDNMMGALADYYRNVKRIPEINMYRMWKKDLAPIIAEYEERFASKTLDTLVAQTAKEFKGFIRITAASRSWPYKQDPGVLYKKLVVGPCKAVVNALDTEVIEPMTYAAFFYHNIQMKSPESINFHKDWLRFRICKFVVEDTTGTLLNAVKKLI